MNKILNQILKFILLAMLVQTFGLVASAIDHDKKIITVNMTEEPRNMDPQKAQDTVAFKVIGHVMEGLTRMDPRSRVVPGQAESWTQLSSTKYRFNLRKSNKWSDGNPVTANDFVFAWRHGVNPKTASLYAFIFFSIKNAELINQGKLPIERLGVKALDKWTLEVELERPTAYFLRLLSFGSFMPAQESFVKKMGRKYASGADKLLYNGPWILSQWKHNSSMKLVKNTKYWNSAKIRINEIHMPYLIRDQNSEFNMFKDGKFDLVETLNKELLPDAQSHKMKIKKYNPGTVWYLQFNTTRKVTGNKWIRKAFNVALNRREFVSKIVGIPGAKPIFGIIPDYMPSVNSTYGKEFSLAFKDGDLKLAKSYLQRGLRELGLKALPKLSLLINDSDVHKRDAEYLQRYYKKTLGVDLSIDVQTFKVRLQKTSNKDFDIVKSGWGPDYLDAMTFADLFSSWNTNNDTGWSDKDYDKAVQNAMDSTDAGVRMKSMHKANQILVEEAPIVPMMQASRVYVQHPDLVGVLRRPISPDPDFYYARIRTKKKK